MILALDTSTPACTAALFAADGSLFASRDEVIGRGHAERLVPMIAEMLDGHLPSQLLVGVGPGSFTGLRIAIAAAQGLGIGWDVPVCGMSSLALLAAGAPGEGPVAAALAGGHGELFVQQFRRAPLRASSDTAEPASRRGRGNHRCASGRRHRRRGPGRRARQRRGAARSCRAPPTPCACRIKLRTPRPQAALRPRAGRAAARGGMSSAAESIRVRLAPGESADLDAVMDVMAAAFDPRFGEGWTRSQCAGILPLSGVLADARRGRADGGVCGFSLLRTVADEAELLLLAVAAERTAARHRRVRCSTISSSMAGALECAGCTSKSGTAIRRSPCIRPSDSRPKAAGASIIRGSDGSQHDALTMAREL